MKLSAFIPCYNQYCYLDTVIHSILEQEVNFDEILIIDDGSRNFDKCFCFVEKYSFKINFIRHDSNKGRGYCRAFAINKLNSELVLMVDASNRLPPNFVKNAISNFSDPLVSAVSGLIHNDTLIDNFNSQWRGRHLFKQNYNFGTTVHEAKSLTTYGTILRRSAVLDVGNFNRELVHSEDKELGDRLLKAGYKIIGDPNLIVYSMKKDTTLSVLERYWRWYGGTDEKFSLRDYWHAIKASFRPMMQEDMRENDWKSAFISFLCPHYGFYRYLYRRFFGKIQKLS